MCNLYHNIIFRSPSLRSRTQSRHHFNTANNVQFVIGQVLQHPTDRHGTVAGWMSDLSLSESDPTGRHGVHTRSAQSSFLKVIQISQRGAGPSSELLAQHKAPNQISLISLPLMRRGIWRTTIQSSMRPQRGLSLSQTFISPGPPRVEAELLYHKCDLRAARLIRSRQI